MWWKPSSEHSIQEAGGKVCGFHSPGWLLGSVNYHLEVTATGSYLWVYSHSLALGLSCEEALLPPETSQRWVQATAQSFPLPLSRCCPGRNSTAPPLWSRSLITASLAVGLWWASVPSAPWRASCVTPTQRRVHHHKVAQVGGGAIDGEGWDRGGRRAGRTSY